jgi:hypothetical protein
MPSKARKLMLLPILVFALTGSGLAKALLGSITITGTEKSSGGVWDTGTVTVTINGLSVWYSYGQFSTPSSVASGLGALISNYCGFPVYAQANGATLNFYQRGSNVINAANIAATSNNPSLFPSPSFQISGLPNLYPPVINALPFSEGPPGMGIQITGQYFGGGGTVSIGGVAPSIIAWTPNTITVQIPPGLAPGTIAPVTVTTWTINIGQHFTFKVDAPFGCN